MVAGRLLAPRFCGVGRLGEIMRDVPKAKRPAGPGRGKKGVKVGSPKDPTLFFAGHR